MIGSVVGRNQGPRARVALSALSALDPDEGSRGIVFSGANIDAETLRRVLTRER